ncbi:uncharacterized protein LOC126662034 [Mercurialis annua]|uniref:uncharacterized protein LOC126662034 n=1 Tax=Mercurialis annua TaxID=3986 RepID=UPI0021610124|nr:uncharacterized protein LOC126662034 [Mercurialis annua]
MEPDLVIHQIDSQLEPANGQEQADVEALNASQEAIPDPVPVSDGQKENANVEANQKKRKVSQQRSVVWDHFDSIKDTKGVILQAKCKYCARIYNCHAKKNGTSTLRGHMLRCTKHPHTIETRQALLSFQPVVNDGCVAAPEMFNVASWKFDQDVIRQAVAYMIIVDELPFKFVEKQGFRKLMSVACPLFKIPSRFTVNRDCYSMFVEERLKLKNILKTSTQRISLTSDSWTSNQRLNYCHDPNY